MNKPVDLDALEHYVRDVVVGGDPNPEEILELIAELRAARTLVEYPGLIWEQVPSNGWWRVYAATRRDEFGTPEDDDGNCRMGAGPTRMDALTALAELEALK